MDIAALDNEEFLERLERYWHSAPVKELGRRHGFSEGAVKAYRSGLNLGFFVRAAGVIQAILDDSQWEKSALEEEIYVLRHDVDEIQARLRAESGHSLEEDPLSLAPNPRQTSYQNDETNRPPHREARR